MYFKTKFAFWYTAIALCLVTLLSRAPFTELSPIVDHVGDDLNLTKTQQGILLSLPTFVMAFFAALVAKIDQKLGLVVTILYGMFAIVLGIIIRDYLSSYFANSAITYLYLGTLILSVGVTIISVLYPSFINGFFPQHLGILNAINGANISVSSLLGTFSALTMIGMGYSWQQVGTFWLIITLVIIVIYLPTFKFTKQRMQEIVAENRAVSFLANSDKVRVSMWKQLAPWCIAITLGIESINFYFALSWFKPYIGQAISNGQFSLLVNIFQVTSLLASLVTPVIVMRYTKYLTSILVLSCIIFSLTTVLMFFVTNYIILVVDFILFGALAGFILAVLLLLLSYKTKTAGATSRLSSLVNSVGFLLAAIYLFGFGWLFDLTGSYTAGIGVTILGCIILPFVAYIATKREIIE